MSEPVNYLLYDGECPMCSRYVQMLRLRETLPGFQLLDARDHADIVTRHRDAGLEINDGMILRVGDASHHGAAALHAIAGLTTSSSLLNKLNARLFASATVSKHAYPWLVGGRNLLLRLLGREKIA